jgi:hypothetical protein
VDEEEGAAGEVELAAALWSIPSPDQGLLADCVEALKE